MSLDLSSLKESKGFGSDNHSGVHPALLEALNNANGGHLPSYGTDPFCLQAQKLFSELFGKKVESHFVFNGTAANTLALKAMTSGFNSVICSDTAHIHHDECGAPEVIAHCKLIALPSVNGKISAKKIEESLIRLGDQHATQPRVVSITQPTELGTLYSVQEIKEICAIAHRHGLFVHVDGARIPNAVTALNSTFQEMITDTGVDVLCFGGTKNGLMFGEAVIFLNTDLAKNFKFIRKQGLNLPSKSRYIAAQFNRFLENELWREIASHSLSMAKELSALLQDIPYTKVTRPVESNAVFATIPKAWLKQVREKYFFYIWDEKTYEARFMTSFDTTMEDLHGFASVLREAANNHSM